MICSPSIQLICQPSSKSRICKIEKLKIKNLQLYVHLVAWHSMSQIDVIKSM
jgi:hypothetical protein